MHRIFKKTGDLAARGREGRARRPRRQRPGLEALEGRQLLSLASQDFLVNVTTRNTQASSDNASAANGLSVAVWTDEANTVDNDIRAQLYNAQGLRRGPEIIVEFSTAIQGRPSVAMDADGDFVVTYEEIKNGQTDIIAKRYNSSGAQVGGRITIANDSVRAERDPDVAMDAVGNFVVSYTLDFKPTDQDVRAKLFNSSGVQTNSISVAQTTDFDEANPSVAMSPDGRFTIAYERGFITSKERVHVARFSAVGTNLGDQLILSQNGGFNPSVAMDNAGNAVVALQTIHSGGTGQFGNQFDIDVARLNSAGSVVSIKNITNSGNAAPPVNNVLPSIALSPTGGSYVVAYDTDLLGIPGRRTVEVAEVSASDAIQGKANLPAFPNNFAPAVSMGANGKYLLTFTAGVGSDNRDIHGRRGVLSGAPAAKNLALTPTIRAGQSASLRGQLTDADADTKLTLTVNWGDGSRVQKSRPGLKPFSLAYKYARAGTYSVHVTWTDTTGLSNSRVLKVKVKAV